MRRVLLAAPPPAPPAGHPAAIAFWDMRRGLYAHESRVSLTTDGGRTFHVVLRTSRPVAGMQAFGKCGAIVDVAGGAALRTLDAGSTWRPFRHAFDADFATPQIGLGFRVGRFEFVRGFYATRDGGASWHARRSPCRGDLPSPPRSSS
ncbi:MAG: hypothetical protein AUG91_00360 [Actinobacteria bacterium 13_1_20CM_4_69_9]|nr:MAG: hypothetical protein AUG91_00360 [Actinobacteria bacterium 13_1_20CM_4_69_9]